MTKIFYIILLLLLSNITASAYNKTSLDSNISNRKLIYLTHEKNTNHQIYSDKKKLLSLSELDKANPITRIQFIESNSKINSNSKKSTLYHANHKIVSSSYPILLALNCNNWKNDFLACMQSCNSLRGRVLKKECAYAGNVCNVCINNCGTKFGHCALQH